MQTTLPSTGTDVADLAGKIFQAKLRSHKAAAALPIEEKLRRLVAMQRRAKEIRISTARPPIRVWELH
jgi:hypothetical protein